MIIGHGGNKQDLARRLNCSVDEITDMSSNLNPLGPPEFIEGILRDNLWKINSLPEPDASSLCKGFARFHQMNDSRVIAGNGTTWFIYTLPYSLASRKVLIAGPTYSDYKDACLMHKIDFLHCHAVPSNGFNLDIDLLSKLAQTADTVFICNPNNPTGTMVSKEELEFLLKKHKHTIFIVDESYLPFVDHFEDLTLVAQSRYENLIVLSSMSKIFTIPGLRTGFLSGPEPLVQKIMAHYQPWSVNALAQAVITYIFDHPETIEPFYKKTRDYIKTERQRFCDRLDSAMGLDLFASCTYFLLARLTKSLRSKQFCEKIGSAGILIRDCSNFDGLSDEYVRFSLKRRSDNQNLAGRIHQVLAHG